MATNIQKIILFTIINLFSFTFVSSQTQVDTTQILQLLTQAESLEGPKPDSALILERKALSIAHQIQNKKWQIESYYYIGWALINKGLYEQANLAFDSAIYLAQKSNLSAQIPQSYNGKAASFQQMGDYQKAAEQYLAALKVLENIPNPDKKTQANIAKIQFNIAVTFKQIENYDDAEKYLQKATNFYLLAKDSSSYIDCLNNFSSLYAAKKDTLKEFSYIKKGFDILQQFPKTNKRTKEVIFFNYGKMLERQGNPSEGLPYVEKAFEYAKENGAFYAARTAMGLGESYLKLKKYDLAQDCQNTISKYATTSHSQRAYADAYLLQSKIDYAQSDYKNAFDHYQTYKIYADSLQSVEKSKGIAQLERQFEGAKKDNLILANKLTIERQTQQIWLALLGIILLSSLLILFWQNTQAKKKQHALSLQQLQQQQEIKTMKALITGEENERSRIAKELHDSVGGLLSTVRLHFDAIKTRTDDLKDNKDYEYALTLLDDSSQYIRQISHHLMPEVLTRYNLIKALKNYIENINRSKLLEIDFQVFGIADEERYSPMFELMLYRIVQELLSNIIKHASATEALLQINRNEDTLSITIEDNGKGFNTKNLPQENSGMGLDGVKNKINYIGGQIDINSQEGMGTSIFIQLALQK